MNQLTEFKETVAQHLAAKLPHATIAPEFPAALFRSPPNRVCVAVGIDQVKLDAPCRMQLTLRFDILCPIGADAECAGVFEELCAALVMEENLFGIAEASCGETRYNDTYGAPLLTARATLFAAITPRADEDGHPFKTLELTMKGL